MTKKHRFTLITFAILLALFFSSMQTMLVRADDTLPPPPATEEPVQLPAEEAVVVQESVAAEAPVVQEPAATEVPVSEEVTTLPEVLEQLPEETTVVVLDESGATLPLATQEAANVIISSDPMWCPGDLPPGSVGCTNTYLTVTDLIANLGSISGAGTIYFTPTYSINDATFDHTNSNLVNLTDLTIQGGWNGLTGARYALSGATAFSVPLTVANWTGNVTLNDLVIGGTDNLVGVSVTTSGDIELNNVDASNNSTNTMFGTVGAQLDAGGDIDVTSSTFNNNGGFGLVAVADGSITLTDVEASKNIGNFFGMDIGAGVYLDASRDIDVTSSTFNNNGGTGLTAYSNGNIVLTDVEASNNMLDFVDSGEGATLYTTGDISVTGSTFSNNEGTGLFAYSASYMSLSGVLADGNGNNGAYLNSTFGTGNITVTASQFNGNGSNGGAEGLQALSNVDINLVDVLAEGNTYSGVFLDNTYGIGNINVTDSQFNENGWGASEGGGEGLVALSNGYINLLNVTANNNYYAGAYLDNWWESSFGNIFVTSSEFSGNGLEDTWDGITAFSNGDVTVQCSRFENNGDYGVYAEMDGGTLTLNGNTYIDSISGDIFLDGGTLVDNPDYVCQVVSEPPAPTTPDPALTNSGSETSVTGNGLPLNVIHVNGGEQTALSCNGFSGTELVLPNGDRIILPCPNGDQASLAPLTSAQLPGTLDGTFTFVSGLDAGVDPSLLGNMIVKFMIPADQQDADFAILHWNGTQWEDLGGYKASDSFFRVDTKSIGIFVLVSK